MVYALFIIILYYSVPQVPHKKQKKKTMKKKETLTGVREGGRGSLNLSLSGWGDVGVRV
jgi:hypothetical protein